MKKQGFVILAILVLIVIAALVGGKANRASSFPELPRNFLVTYGSDVKEVIRNQGYHIHDEWYYKNMIPTPDPWSGTTKIKIDLFNFGRDIDYDSALTELNERGMRPITMSEFIAFDTLYLKFQKEYLGKIPPAIIILGTAWYWYNDRYGQYEYAVYYQAGDGSRHLYLDDGGCSKLCYFAVVEKM